MLQRKGFEGSRCLWTWQQLMGFKIFRKKQRTGKGQVERRKERQSQLTEYIRPSWPVPRSCYLLCHALSLVYAVQSTAQTYGGFQGKKICQLRADTHNLLETWPWPTIWETLPWNEFWQWRGIWVTFSLFWELAVRSNIVIWHHLISMYTQSNLNPTRHQYLMWQEQIPLSCHPKCCTRSYRCIISASTNRIPQWPRTLEVGAVTYIQKPMHGHP